MARKRTKKRKSTCSFKSMKSVGRRCFCGKRGKKKMVKSSRCR